MSLNTNAWNRIRYTVAAPIYDTLVRFGRQRRRAIELLGLRPGERVLISGAGTGEDLSYLPEGVETVAVDITPAMVERTTGTADRLRRNVEARVMDAAALKPHSVEP